MTESADNTAAQQIGARFAPAEASDVSEGKMRYRDMPQFVMRRVDNMAGEVNGFLVIIAIGLGMLDLLCLLERFVDAMPPAVQSVVH